MEGMCTSEHDGVTTEAGYAACVASATLLVVVLVVSAPLLRAELSSVFKVVLPGSYANLLMLLMPKSRVSGWLLWLLLWSLVPVSMLVVSMLSSRAVLLMELLLELWGFFCRTCACGFAIAGEAEVDVVGVGHVVAAGGGAGRIGAVIAC